jgi:L,D-transpeptidase ErfK/SrfK
MFKKLVLICGLLTGSSGGVAQAGYDKPYVGEIINYDAKYEDTFVHLARDYGLGFTEMRAANPYVDPWLPGAGTDLILPTMHILPDAPRKGVVINLADMRLYAFLNGDNEPWHTPIGVGREGLNTPEGITKIVRKAEGPVWRPTDRMRKEDPTLKVAYGQGPDNPMGTHALYFGWPQYAMHGTNRPFGIGRRVSSGCIRLYPEKIIEAFNLIPVGTQVTVVNQPLKFAWIDDKLYMEAHPTLEQSVAMEEKALVPEKKMSNAEMKALIEIAGVNQDRLRWPAIRKALKERNGYPVMIARRPGIGEDGDLELEEADLGTPEEAMDLLEGSSAKPSAQVEPVKAADAKPIVIEEVEENYSQDSDAAKVTEDATRRSYSLNN